jgi:hypothetical protein
MELLPALCNDRGQGRNKNMAVISVRLPGRFAFARAACAPVPTVCSSSPASNMERLNILAL